MKCIVNIILVLILFSGCATKFVSIENKNFSFPSSKNAKYWFKDYKIKYPIYSKKLKISSIIYIKNTKGNIISRKDFLDALKSTKIIKKDGYYLVYNELIILKQNKKFLTYMKYKVNPEIRDIYDLDINYPDELKLNKKELSGIKKEIINNENLLINAVTYGIHRGLIISKYAFNDPLDNSKKIYITKTIDGTDIFGKHNVIITYDSLDSSFIKCGGFSYLDYNTLATLFTNDICYTVISEKGKEFTLKIDMREEPNFVTF